MVRYKISRYRASDSMADLICDNYQMLIVMDRFGIPLGVGEHTIEEVCRDNGVDVVTFLAVVNLLLGGNEVSVEVLESISTKDLIGYLLNSHRYYTEYRLPEIRAKLVEAIDGDDVSSLIVNYFDQYTSKIGDHLRYEEQVVFPYVKRLCSGERSDDYSISVFSSSHDHIDEPLDELKNIIIKYYQGESNDNLIMVLHDILSCSNDLLTHNLVEDSILVPLVKKIEEYGNA
ncbi:MAG: hemerythrin domain-containing protein [Rikenellaceae bacterium]